VLSPRPVLLEAIIASTLERAPLVRFLSPFHHHLNGYLLVCVGANGLQMKVWTCFNDLPQQNWTVSSSGQIKLAGTNFCLDLTDGSTANRNILQLWTCSNGNANQVWTM
jgi:hypothetical protein